MRGAIEIARYFTAHMIALCGAEDLSPEADAVLKVLRRCGVERFSQSYVRRKLHGRRGLDSLEAVELALAELRDTGFIIPLPPEGTTSSGGRPPSPRYALVKDPK